MNNAGSFAIALLEKDLIKDRQELLCPGANSALVTIPTKAEFLSIDDPSRAAETRSHMVDHTATRLAIATSRKAMDSDSLAIHVQ